MRGILTFRLTISAKTTMVGKFSKNALRFMKYPDANTILKTRNEKMKKERLYTTG